MDKVIKPKYGRGMVFALGGPVVGIALFVALWEIGFIASIASLALAWLTVYLYGKGAGSIDKKSIYIILSYISVGLVVCILSMIVADCLRYALDSLKTTSVISLLTSTEFWSYVWQNMTQNGEMWKSYATNILMAVGFSVWGAYGIVKQLIVDLKA